MKLSLNMSLLVFTLIFLQGVGCNTSSMVKVPVFTIEAENFSNRDGDIQIISDEKGDQLVRLSSSEGWISFEADVTIAGRYKCEILAKSAENPATCWIEDYIGDADNRIYNITNIMQIPGETSTVIIYKDGSPLNVGKHKMKLHIKGIGVEIDWIRFSLIKKHQLTPLILKQSTDGEEWKLVWSDEFNGNGSPDSSNWTYDIGNWGWGNNEPQYYTANRLENAHQEDGNLIIEARKDDMGYEWTSARLTTRGKVSFIYGKIEFRAKVPVGDGTWAAGWLLGDAYRDEISWPYCGEIDVLECVGREIDDTSGDGINHASCHTRTYYFKQGNQITAVIDVKNMKDEYHLYAIEWYPDRIDAFVDGVKYYTYDKIKDELEWPFNNPQNIIINLAIGGGMGGPIDQNLTREQFILDYVRVYELR